MKLHHIRKNHQSKTYFKVNYIEKKADICQKTRSFVKNVCFETRFMQLSGIQQIILS